MVHIILGFPNPGSLEDGYCIHITIGNMEIHRSEGGKLVVPGIVFIFDPEADLDKTGYRKIPGQKASRQQVYFSDCH